MQRLIALLILFLTIGASGSGGTAPDGTTLNCIGKHTVTVRATDARGAYATQSYTLFVTEQPNAAPEITGLPVKQARATYAYSYRVVASDADGDPLSYSLGW